MAKKKVLQKKLYTVQKFIQAKSAAEAIRLERKHPVDDVWIESKWRENNVDAIGFSVETENESS